MAVEQTQYSTQGSTVQNIPSQLQQNFWGGVAGAAQGLIWPNGNFLETPQYGGNLTAPMSPAMMQYLQQTGGLAGPDFSGVMQNANNFAQQASAGIRNPNDINITANYTPTQFSTPQFQMQNPFAGYNGGQGMQVSAPGGIGTTADYYRTNVDQVQAPAGVQYDRISGLPQIQGPNLQNYQMGPAQQVQAPGGLSSFDINPAASVQAGNVGTQSFLGQGTAQSYMNPYTQNVLDVQKDAAQRDYNQQLTQIHSDAAKAGAFGGSRQAVMDATANRDLQDRMANIQATGQQQAFNQAQQQFNTEQQLGLGAQQFNVQSGLQAGLANQSTQQQAALANQQARLAAQGLGTQTGLQAALANQQAGLTVGGQNLQALLGVQNLGATLGQQGQIANQQMAYQQQLANQQAGLQAGIFNNTQALQAQQMNQAANLQAGLAAQQLGFQGANAAAGFNMQSQLANQQAQEAALQRQYGALGQQYQGNLQSGLQTQNLGQQAQQLASQANMYGAGLGLQAQTANEQARQQQQGQNLNYLNFMGNQNTQYGNWQQQGFNNTMGINSAYGQAANMQQGYDQAAADRNYQYWQYQQAYPFQSLDWLANIGTKFPAQGAVQTNQQGMQQITTPDPSLYNQIMGGVGYAAGMFARGAGMAKGGEVKEFRPRRPNYSSGLTALRQAA